MAQKFTTPQRRFFESYLCELSQDLLDGDRAPFVDFLLRTDFDGPATAGDIQVAQNLLAAGFLKRADRHGANHVHVEFSPLGADAIWWVHNHPLVVQV